jgi:hypothetical protein
MLTQQLRMDEQVDQLDFFLVPVAVEVSSSTSSTTAVKPLQTISTTYIRSANNSDNPMDIEMVYAGFNKVNR